MLDRPDDALVLAVLGGDADAATVLFRRHLGPLYAFVARRVGSRRSDADEVVHDVFLDAWRELSRFDRSRSFGAWLCGIARRKLARYRRASRHSGHESLTTVVDDRPGPLQSLVSAEHARLVNEALERLSPIHATLLLAKYAEGKSLADIGRELAMSPQAVSSGLQRARRALSEQVLKPGGSHAATRRA